MNIGLIFGVIVAIFMMGILLVFGYQQLVNVQTMQANAEVKKTLKNLETVVDRVYSMGGETSEKYRLTFPADVSFVCFMPYYRDKSVNEKSSLVKMDVGKVLGDVGGVTGYQRNQLMSLLTAMRIAPNPENVNEYIDKGQTLLVFYKSSEVPEWHYVEHLEPSKKGNEYSGDILCESGRSEVWLQRKFDESGAWVDVEEI